MTASNDTPIGSGFDHHIARIGVGAYDGAQDVRTATMNRVRDIIRKRNEGIPFDRPEPEKDDDEQSFDSKYEDDELPGLVDRMRADDRISEHEAEYLREMLAIAGVAEEIEERAKGIMELSQNEPIYTEWLENVYGVSGVLTARLLDTYGYCGPVRVTEAETGDVLYDEERDGHDGAVQEMEKASAANRRARENDRDEPYTIDGRARVSQIWSYSGLAPGQTRRRGERLSYDPEAKTLAWLVADRMIMQGDRSLYKQHFFDPYKQKQVTRLERGQEGLCVLCGADEQAVEVDDEGEKTEHDVCASCLSQKRSSGGGVPSAPNSRGHADLRARRYLAKKFLHHYMVIARDLIGLETPDTWVTSHTDHEKDEESFENAFHARRVLRNRD